MLTVHERKKMSAHIVAIPAHSPITSSAILGLVRAKSSAGITTFVGALKTKGNKYASPKTNTVAKNKRMAVRLARTGHPMTRLAVNARMGVIKGESNIAPITTAEEFLTRPKEAIKAESASSK